VFNWVKEKQVSHTQTQDKNNTTNDHTKEHPPHRTTIECGTMTVGDNPNCAHKMYSCILSSCELIPTQPGAPCTSTEPCVRPYARLTLGLHVEYAEREKEYGILFIFSLFCECIHLEYVRIHVIYRVNQAKYVIHMLVVAPQRYVHTYNT